MNSRYLSLIVFILMSVSNCALSQSILTVNEDFNIISANGKQANKLFSQETTVQLIPGVNKIALEYEVVFENDDDFELIKSEPFLVSFYATKGKNYFIKYLKKSNSRAAHQFAKQPSISVANQYQKLVRSQVSFLNSESTRLINLETKPKLGLQEPINITSNSDTNKKRAIGVQQENPEKMLEYWWSKATKKQKESFLNKVIVND